MTIEVIYTLTIEDEDIPVRGNAQASGDDEDDREVEDGIIRRLERGDLWAWCTVKVTATIEGCDEVGTNYLGGCSYEDEKDFCAEGGYYKDMCHEAREDLIGNLRAARERGSECERMLEELAKAEG